MKNLQKGFIVPVLLAIIAVLVIGGGVYIYESKKTETPLVVNNQNQLPNQNQQQTNTQTPPVKTPTPTPTPQPQTETPVGENITSQPAYLITAYSKNGKNYIDVDYVNWLHGDASIKAQVADGKCASVNDCQAYPNGYKQNLNPKVRTFEVSPSASINVSGMINGTLNSYTTNSLSISFNTFEGVVSKLKPYLPSSPSFKDPLDFITIDVKDNIVTKIVEPYQE